MKNISLANKTFGTGNGEHYSWTMGYDVTTDYLLNGTMQDKSADAIIDEELLSQFRKVEQLPANKKKLVKEFLDAFIFKSDLQKQLSS